MRCSSPAFVLGLSAGLDFPFGLLADGGLAGQEDLRQPSQRQYGCHKRDGTRPAPRASPQEGR